MDGLTLLVAGDDAIDWAEFWESLTPLWRRVLCGSDTPVPPPPEPILRRHRLTTDYAWVGSFEPIRWLPSVTEALLWEDNGMDLGPLAGRSWELLQLAGPAANVDLGQLSGTPVRRLILSNLDVRSLDGLRDIVGLESLTLAHGDFGLLPPLEHLTDVVLYAEGTVELSAAQHPRLRVTRHDEVYLAPFGPDDV
ncbi:hypothetical protein [Actinomadura sp. 6K520]|jgi:hypothetical protein|uniref:hypothetical protein n=1 Tax=Actinomadura sp. 6K520 TaxID=2530364 RepID=UPI00104D86E9|nr:hypothetical protein [Actinomadura sp. 6K520]TDE19123.1 hypothetical protein E1289_33795 [Actinomadura sp. 6K520]